jgi:hypothetical protein
MIFLLQMAILDIQSDTSVGPILECPTIWIIFNEMVEGPCAHPRLDLARGPSGGHICRWYLDTYSHKGYNILEQLNMITNGDILNFDLCDLEK